MPYRYLIYYRMLTDSPFYTGRIEMSSFENGDTVAFDLYEHRYTYDGITWNEIDEDHL